MNGTPKTPPPNYQESKSYYENLYGNTDWSTFPKPDYEYDDDKTRFKENIFFRDSEFSPSDLEVLKNYNLTHNDFFSICTLLATAIFNNAENVLNTWLYKGRWKKSHRHIVGNMLMEMPLALKLKNMSLTQIFKSIREQVLNSDDIEILNHSRDYYSFYKFVILTDPLVTLLSTMVYNDGDYLISNISNIAQVIINIFLSIFFAMGLNMGVSGIALGTLAKNAVAVIILSIHFFRESNSLKPRIYFSFRDLWKFCEYGFVDVGIYLTLSLVFFIMNKFIIFKFGDEFLPVLSVAINILWLSVIFVGIAQGILPLVGVYYNEKNYPAVRKVMNTAMKFSVIEGVIFSLVFFIFADKIPFMLGINEPEIVKYSTYAVRIVSSTLTVLSVLYLWETYYIIQEKNIISLICLLLRSLVFMPLLSIPFGLVFGINGVSLGLAATPLCTLILCSFLTCVKYGRENFPYYLEDKNDTADFDVVLTPENINKTRDESEKFMTERHVLSNIINTIMLLIEETGNMIKELNDGKNILAEYTIRIEGNNRVKLVVRDDGKIFDITDKDMNIKSFRSYFLTRFLSMKEFEDNENITTISNNRNIFTVS